MIRIFLSLYRPGRYAVWFVLGYLPVLALGVALRLVFNPPMWVLFVCCSALTIAMPTPKWVRR